MPHFSGMVKTAIITDIHANRQALEAVLADARARARGTTPSWATWSAMAPIPAG